MGTIIPYTKSDGMMSASTKAALDSEDTEILKFYGSSLYFKQISKVQKDIADCQDEIIKYQGIKEDETGLSLRSQWNPSQDEMLVKNVPRKMVGIVEKVVETTPKVKVIVSIKPMGKYVVEPHRGAIPAEDLTSGTRVACELSKYEITSVLPRKIDATVTSMIVEKKPNVTYADVGGAKEELERLKEIVELPLLHPERFIKIGVNPPKGVLLYGPPGTGKTLTARAVANKTEATFICVIGSELVQKYVGEGARLVRDLFELARMQKACILFIDEIDAIGGTRDSSGGDSEVQRTMLEIVNQLDGFESTGNIKVLMATNRPSTLDPALSRPGRLDRKIEFGLPDIEGRAQIFKVHAKNMKKQGEIRYELLARLCNNCTGADLKSVCSEAGMFAIRERRKSVIEQDFISAINKVIEGYKKFTATTKYMVYN